MSEGPRYHQSKYGCRYDTQDQVDEDQLKIVYMESVVQKRRHLLTQAIPYSASQIECDLWCQVYNLNICTF